MKKEKVLCQCDNGDCQLRTLAVPWTECPRCKTQGRMSPAKVRQLGQDDDDEAYA